MHQPVPADIGSAGIASAPIEHTWDEDLALRLYAQKDPNMKLHRAIDEANFKAKMAAGVAITDWLLWRFEGHADLRDARLRLEAARASAVNSAYAKDLRFELKQELLFSKVPAVDGPIQLALTFLGSMDARYATGNVFLAAPIVKQVLLARHVMPNKKAFESWLSASLRHAAEVFPRGPTYERGTKHDASAEAPVPREFFEPDFTYTSESGAEALRRFLKTLDPKANPYLYSAEEMRARGFKETPYTL